MPPTTKDIGGMQNLQRATAPTQMIQAPVANQLLAPAPQMGPGPLLNIGTVGDINTSPVLGQQLDSFSVTLANTSSGAQTYIIGDPGDMIADLIGGTLLDPTSGSIGVLPMKYTFGVAPVAIRGFNYEVITSASQFNNPFTMYSADINGQMFQKRIPVAQSQRNNQFNSLLLTLEFQAVPFWFSWQSAMTLRVNPGETVNLVFTPWYSGNRA